MADTSIEWSDKTWNPVVGCSIVSPGCHNCYAMRMAYRLAAMGQEKYVGTTDKVEGRIRWTGNLRMDYDALALPLKWRKPQRIFVNSMSDLFHEDVPDDFIDRVFGVMALCGQHVFQILTKRADRLPEYFSRDRSNSIYQAVQQLADQHGIADYLFDDWPWPHVWLGVSVEDQKRADERIPQLLDTPADVRFLSCEPLLGPVDLASAVVKRRLGAAQPDWVIVGGESGPRARSCDLAWIRSIVEQCRAAEVPCFVKQLGSRPFDSFYREGVADQRIHLKDGKGGDPCEWPTNIRVRQWPEVSHA